MFRWAAGLLALAVFVFSIGGYIVIKYFDGALGRIHLDLGQDRPAEADGDQNWLLVGTDSRAGTGNEYGGTQLVSGERSDTTILAHLDADGTAKLISFPRDTLVEIPAYDDAQGNSHPSHMDKFNNAIQLGGPSLLARMVEQLTGLPVDHYASVDLAGFKQISNAIGGVDVCILPSDYRESGLDDNGHPYVATNINDPYSGFHGHVGTQTVQGESALAFVRQRHGLPHGDLDRIQRQQQFLGAVFRKATSFGTLANPAKVIGLINAVKGALNTDENTHVTDLENLATRLKGVDQSKVQFVTAPTRELSTSDTNLGRVFRDSGGALELVPTGQDQSVGNVQILEQDKFQALLDQVKGQNPSPSASASGGGGAPAAASVPLSPSRVTVRVENGTDQRGLAGQATSALEKQGFHTLTPREADTTTYGQSVVRYAQGHEDEARTVAGAVPGAILQQDSSLSGGGIILVVGSSYQGVVPVQAAGTPSSAAPAPTASSPGSTDTSPMSADPHCTY